MSVSIRRSAQELLTAWILPLPKLGARFPPWGRDPGPCALPPTPRLLFKRLGGTVAVSSVGMFGPTGGWGIPLSPATLTVAVGGITTKPRCVDGRLEPRELLDFTISVDHEVVDGAPAARFARRLVELIGQPDGLG